MELTRITIYPNQIELKFIKKEAKEAGRSMSNYIIYLIQREMLKNGK